MFLEQDNVLRDPTLKDLVKINSIKIDPGISYDTKGKFIAKDLSLSDTQEVLKIISKPSKFSKDFKLHRKDNLEQEINIMYKKWSLYMKYNHMMKTEPLNNNFYELLKDNLLGKHEFALKQKQLFDFSIRKTLCIDEQKNCFDQYETLRNINQIFPGEHLLPFEHPKAYKDVEDYSFKEYPPIEKSLRSQLKDIIAKNIKKNVILRDLDKIDLINLSNTKKIIDSKFSSSISNRKRIKTGFQCDLASSLVFKIDSITKSPVEARVIAISDEPSRNLLYICREMTSLINNAKFDYYSKEKRSALWRIHKDLSYSDKDLFINFDQKKSGWSFPIDLITLYYEVINEFYETDYFKRILNIFKNKNIFYMIKGTLRRPDNGFILGMNDHICSFLMSCIFELFLSKEQLEEKEVKGFFFGDDCTIKFCNYETNDLDYKSVWVQWLKLCKVLNINVNIEKSFMSNSSVFCEIYGHREGYVLDKTLKVVLSVFDFLRENSILEKKHCFKNWYELLVRTLPWLEKPHQDVIRLISAEAISIFLSETGFEFSVKEWDLPFEIGGWHSFYKDGKNSCLEYIIENQLTVSNKFIRLGLEPISSNISYFDKEMSKLLEQSVDIKLIKQIKSKDKFKSVSDLLLKSFSNKNSSEKSNFFIEKRYWDRLYERRQRTFNKNNYVNIYTIINKIIKEGDFKGFYIPDQILEPITMVEDFDTFYSKKFSYKITNRHPIDKIRAILTLEGLDKEFLIKYKVKPKMIDLYEKVYPYLMDCHPLLTKKWSFICHYNDMSSTTLINDMERRQVNPMVLGLPYWLELPDPLNYQNVNYDYLVFDKRNCFFYPLKYNEVVKLYENDLERNLDKTALTLLPEDILAYITLDEIRDIHTYINDNNQEDLLTDLNDDDKRFLGIQNQDVIVDVKIDDDLVFDLTKLGEDIDFSDSEESEKEKYNSDKEEIDEEFIVFQDYLDLEPQSKERFTPLIDKTS